MKMQRKLNNFGVKHGNRKKKQNNNNRKIEWINNMKKETYT